MNSGDKKKKGLDGGWGWLVCLGSSLITLSLRSLDPSFGLLFHDLFIELEIDSTGASFIMSILDAIVNFSGLLIGPLLKKYSYRQVAFFGSLLSCTGLILTSRANSMFHIVCTYSVLGGLGTGLAIASAFVALNTFFEKKRGQAVGFSMAGTTLAMMIVPQLIHLLLNSYGFRGAMLVIGGWALHSTIGACLLRPFESEIESTNADTKDIGRLFEGTWSTGMSKAEVASCLSISAFTDILARLLLPTIFDRLGLKNRTIFWIFCILVGIGRSIMAAQSKGVLLIITFVIIGFLRGATLVNLNLTVSEYCPLNKLPNAFGMFMVFKGLFVVMLSPLIGYIRDVSESYALCIHVMTLMISITFITWSIECMYRTFKNRKSVLAKQAQDIVIE
ncbi:monocarboxylate transporter 2-like isoform X3 [Bombus vosnesenskii]|uniref:Monocarboxylate transporter 2-like isoform X3 n=2 Tax=Pyrobombus TaxID=144703 RepID=A0A6J3L6F6_9HYME|nr:monocarboxylate transporter 2-like isoform X2 [Bombus vancouverensis nearcticus]XP_033303187.1 monocarboxylate transporter 2-like isoform X4 [Bombus bifarius]XP_033361203.1 monocarboxylate transporter 2-like isoform X3 [Bombus vosnesenskii]